MLTDSVPQLIWENNPSGEAIYFNKRWFEFSGLSYEDSLGAGWVMMAHPDDDKAIVKWRQSLNDKILFESEVRLRRYDGEYIWHLLRTHLYWIPMERWLDGSVPLLIYRIKNKLPGFIMKLQRSWGQYWKLQLISQL